MFTTRPFQWGTSFALSDTSDYISREVCVKESLFKNSEMLTKLWKCIANFTSGASTSLQSCLKKTFKARHSEVLKPKWSKGICIKTTDLSSCAFINFKYQFVVVLNYNKNTHSTYGNPNILWGCSECFVLTINYQPETRCPTQTHNLNHMWASAWLHAQWKGLISCGHTVHCTTEYYFIMR